MADKKLPAPPGDPQTDALIREVDEELRHEQLSKLWKLYGPWVIAAAVAVVLVVAGREGWRAWQAEVQAADARAYEQAARLARADQRAEAVAALGGVAGSATTGYATLAALQQAALLAEDGKPAEAVSIYRRLAADAGTDPALRDLARLLTVQHGLDSGDPQDLAATLAPLVNPANPFHHLALEMQGALALKQGERAKARDIFTGLADDAAAPAGVRGRARDLAAALANG